MIYSCIYINNKNPVINIHFISQMHAPPITINESELFDIKNEGHSVVVSSQYLISKKLMTFPKNTLIFDEGQTKYRTRKTLKETDKEYNIWS